MTGAGDASRERGPRIPTRRRVSTGLRNASIVAPRRAANSTLQDRLVEELRLRGISSIEAANTFAPEFVADYNARFATAAQNPFNDHRPVLSNEVLDEIFTWQETRKLSQSLRFSYQRQPVLIPPGNGTLTP